MSKHTPGPWEWWETNWGIETDACGPVKMGYRKNDLEGMREEALANARLIAAAPDMLAALDDITHELAHMMRARHVILEAGSRERVWQGITIARAAIVKATGGEE